MKYMLFYSEAASPKIRYFDSQTEAEVWAGQFLLRNQQNTDDNWIDMIIQGRIKARYSAWSMEIATEKDEQPSFTKKNLSKG